MCGYTITKNEILNLTEHRGLTFVFKKTNYWNIWFNSLPLSSNGTRLEQPLKGKDFYLLFNGEIFNYKELERGVFSDLDYLYKLVVRKGMNQLELYNESLKWDGFWSISIIKDNGDVFLFTDPLGKKQLYHSQDGISSEIKPLLVSEMPLILPYNEKSFHTSQTPFQGIYRVLPGVLYCYKPKNQMAYAEGKLIYLNKSYQAKESLVDLISSSLRRRLENRIDGVTLLLSGGLDSSILLHHLCSYTKDFEILTIENGETEIVDELCRKYQMPYRMISSEITEEELTDAVHSYEHPLDYGSLIPNYLLFKESTNRVILTGDGADEFFGGYNRNLKNDTWDYDVHYELPYYHNIRLDRLSMAFTKEVRSPLMSMPLYHFCRFIPYHLRMDKIYLRNAYRGLLPDFIINGNKIPLRHKNDKAYNQNLIKNKFTQLWS